MRRFVPVSTTTIGQAIATSCIHSIDELQAGDRVILCVRVSRRAQKAAGNLDNQERHLRFVAEAYGATVLDVVRHVGPGWNLDWLLPAISLAKRLGAKLLAESVSRFVRSVNYHSVNAPDAQPSEEQLKRLGLACDGVILITALNPNSTPAEERGSQTKRGQAAKGHRGGRPMSKKPGLSESVGSGRNRWRAGCERRAIRSVRLPRNLVYGDRRSNDGSNP